MSTQKRRFMLTVTADIEEEAAIAKREQFYDKPYSEMYRYLIRLGLDSLKAEKKEKKKK